MTRVRIDLFASLDGFTSAGDGADNPMGADWGPLTAAYAATRTFRQHVFGDTTGSGTTGLDDSHAAAFFEGVGAEIMGAAMFGLHAVPDDPEWQGWWGDTPPFRSPVYVLTHTAPRPSIPLQGGTTFHFRSAPIADVLAEASEAAGGLDVRVGGGIGTAREFLRAGLVDDLHVMIAPIVLDRGHRVWEELRGLELTHTVTSQVSESGTIHVTFARPAGRMTVERRLARAGFTLTRDYPAPVERVWDAFADEDQKLAWWGAGDAIEPGEWVFDFRVGGRDVAEGRFHDGPVSRYEATYADIVEHVRIVTTYDMWLDGVHMSTSVASLEFERVDGGTRFTHVEHGVFFDRFWADGPQRETGTRGLLDALGRHLGRGVAGG